MPENKTNEKPAGDPIATKNNNAANGDKRDESKGKGSDEKPGSNENAKKQDSNQEGFGEDE